MVSRPGIAPPSPSSLTSPLVASVLSVVSGVSSGHRLSQAGSIASCRPLPPGGLSMSPHYELSLPSPSLEALSGTVIFKAFGKHRVLCVLIYP